MSSEDTLKEKEERIDPVKSEIPTNHEVEGILHRCYVCMKTKKTVTIGLWLQELKGHETYQGKELCLDNCSHYQSFRFFKGLADEMNKLRVELSGEQIKKDNDSLNPLVLTSKGDQITKLLEEKWETYLKELINYHTNDSNWHACSII